jgi:hypothetical protein
MISLFSYARFAAVVLPFLVGCAGDLGERLQSGQVLPWHGLQGRWIGSVVPTDASCGHMAQGLMSIGENGFGFDPFQSTTVLQGVVGNDGHLTGTLVRQGTERQSLSINFDGSATQGNSKADTISGILVSGRCKWMVTLHRG